MSALPMPIRSTLASRPGWLIVILLSLLALPFSAQAQIANPPRPTFTAVTANSLTMTWATVAGATGYEWVRRLPDDRIQPSGQTDASTRSVTLTGLDPGKLYGYIVHTIVNGQKSTGSGVASQYTSPIAPRNLRAVCVAGTVAQLVWDDSSGATAYEVKIDSGVWQSRGKTTSRVFSQLALNTAYTFHVRALIPVDPNFSLLEALSAESSLTVTTQAAHVDPPTNLQTSEITQSGIKLTWGASPTSGVTSYEVSANGGAWVDSGGDLEHSFTGLDPDTRYRLRARAKTSANTSCPASAAAVSTLPNPPAAPTGLTTSGITQTAITLTWSAAARAVSYEVQGGTHTSWHSVGAALTYEFTGLTADTAYTLKVRAKNTGGVSAEATTSPGPRTLPNAPPAPAGLTTSGITQSAITLTWSAAARAVSYEVQGGTHTSWHSVGAALTYEFTGLTADTAYTLKVRAKNTGGVSAEATTSPSPKTLPNAPAAPGDFAASGVTQTAITVTWTKSTGATGYKVQVGSGTVTTLGNVATYTFSGLDAGTSYTLKVSATNAGGDSTAKDITVVTVPPDPTGLSTSGITQTGVTLSWTKSTKATGYKVRKDSGDSWTVLGDVATYVFTGLTADTEYDLEVLASNSSGDSDPAMVSVTTLPNAPAAPEDFAASGVTQTSITVTWTKSAGATAYKVRAGTSGDFTALGDVATYTFTGLTANTAYTLQVRASNAGGDSSSAQTTATTNNVPPPPAPAAPTDLATSGITQTSITLTWTKSTTATGYKVQVGSGTVTTLGNVATYTFSGLDAGTSYTLKVSATNAGGDSAAEDITVVTVPPDPTGLKTSGITQTGVTLSWTKSTKATGYKVRKDSGDSWTVLGDVATYAFTGLTADTEYDLEVLASNSSGDSDPAMVSVTTLPNAPAAPEDFAASGVTQTSITVTWTKSAGATAYKVRKVGGDGGWTTLGDVATFTFSNLDAGTSYDLELLATNAGGDSSTEDITVVTVPPDPTGLTTSGITQTSITLNWGESDGATSYDIKLSTANTWTSLGDVLTYNFTGLTANTQYTLQVRAKNSSGVSGAASSAARTLAQQPATLASPGSVATSGITQTAITLTWTKSDGASSYEVQGGALTSWTDAGDVASYAFSGLSADTQYTLQVRAKDSQRTSAAVSVNARTLPNPPGQPSGLQASLTEPDSVEVEWSPSAGAQSYEILGTVNSDDPVGQAAAIGALGNWMNVGNVNSYIISGLSSDTEYTVEVRAVNLGGASEPSAVGFRTQTDRQPIVDLGQGGGLSDTAPGRGSADDDSRQSGFGADIGPTATATATATLTGPAFSCNDEQKAMIEISSHPIGLNVQCVGPAGVGIPGLIARGVVLGVDVWGWVRGNFEVCFMQAGDLVFLDAAYAPRLQLDVAPYDRDGMICSQVDRAGTLVLLRSATPVAAQAPTASPPALQGQSGDCKATTTDPLNFRASPGGQILLTLPALTTLSVYDNQSGWLLVEYNGRRGWISGVYTVQTGVCG
ncbi:MAG: fibronectin type III domain-containing protein [Chloroflexota bacterium]|nr:fibronectin type III domain-containing protein [Chloroflexota bacterium]